MNDAPPRAPMRIECPIDLFEDREAEIERLTAAINRASALEEKGRLGREMLRCLSTLLDCTAYDPNNPSCVYCRAFSALRHKTATVIDRARELRG